MKVLDERLSLLSEARVSVLWRFGARTPLPQSLHCPILNSASLACHATSPVTTRNGHSVIAFWSLFTLGRVQGSTSCPQHLLALLYVIQETRWGRIGFVFASVVITERPKAFFLPINVCGYWKRSTVLEDKEVLPSTLEWSRVNVCCLGLLDAECVSLCVELSKWTHKKHRVGGWVACPWTANYPSRVGGAERGSGPWEQWKCLQETLLWVVLDFVCPRFFEV